jgi:AraC-like DNA-binding protein
MGRPSKLTEKQWEQIGKRLLEGEKASDLAREFKVSRATLSQRFSKSVGNVKTVANQILETEHALKSLTLSEQVSAISLADQLRSISGHLAGAANYSAATSHRLAGIANLKVQEIDDAKPLDDESRTSLKDVAVLQRMANDASAIPLNLLAANKDTVKQITAEDTTVLPVKVVIDVEDASLPEPEAQ